MSRYLIVVAEGGPRSGDKLLVQPLVDGKFLVGRALRADIPLPAGESAVGQQHCYLRIEGGSVWLDTLANQEVYLDVGRPGFQPRRIDTPTSVKLLPQDKLSERVLELGGLARNVERPGGPFTGVGQTRLRIRLAKNKDAKVKTEQSRRAAKRLNAILASRRWLQWTSATASILIFALVGGGVAATWWLAAGGVTRNTEVIAANTEIVADDAVKPPVSIEEMQQRLGIEDQRVSKYYADLIGAIRDQHRQTVDLVAASPAAFGPKTPAFYRDAQSSTWIVGSVDKAGAFEGVGTAWAMEKTPGVQRRVLITSNHVLSMLNSRRASGAVPVIRRTDEHSETVQHSLDQAALADKGSPHPLFAAFNRKQQGIRNRVNVFDVARLTLADPAKDEALGAGLKLASTDDLRSLSRQAEVGYIGFPYQNLSPRGANAVQPTPVYVRGYISGLKDAFLQNLPDGRWQERELLTVSAATTGAASGSPVFNAEGRVIGLVSGDDVLHIDGSALSDGSSTAAIGFAYVIRSDVIAELANGDPPANRDDQWQKALAESGKDGERADFVSWKNRNCPDEAPPAHVASEAKLDAAGFYENRLEEATDKAVYASAQIADSGRIRDFDIVFGGGLTPTSASLPSRISAQTQFNLRGPSQARLVITGTPLATILVDRYSCNLRPSTAGAAQ